MAIIQFPGTDFHDLNLDWVLQQVKNLLTEWASTKQEWETLEGSNEAFVSFITAQWYDFKTYVENYLANLPLTEEVSAKINAMAEDGTLLELITHDDGEGSALSDVAAQWLAAHITQETGYVIDDSLTVQGAAADAKATGDQISDLKGAIEKLPYINEYDKSTITNGKYISSAGGETTLDAWCITDYMPVNQGDDAYYNGITLPGGIVYSAYYLADKTLYGTFKQQAGENVLNTNVPGLAYVRFSLNVTQSTDSQTFRFYRKSIATLQDLGEAVAPKVEIVLPTHLYIAVGRQITLYTPNYIKAENPNDFAYYWYISPNPASLPMTKIGPTVRFMPSASAIGTHILHLDVMDRFTGETIAKKSMTVEVVADTTRTGKKVLFIGDSLTSYGYYPYEIQHALSNGGVESIGTLTSTGYYDHVITTPVSVTHEGRGGWSAYDYVTKASKDGVINAFWNPSTAKFDFDYYMNQTGFSLPDIVFINLGTNGTSNPNAEIQAITGMIESIRAYSANVPIVVSAIPCGNATQGNYQDTILTAVRVKQLEAFDGTMTNVHIAPIYLNLNRDTDFNTETVAESERNPVEVVRQIEGVHPSKYGFWKFADVYWSVIQKILG